MKTVIEITRRFSVSIDTIRDYTELRFLRKDTSPCAATVVFSGLDISEELPLNKPKDIRLPPLAAGKHPFICQMQMYRGELL